MGLENIIYKHNCIGKNGKKITTYKIRTMTYNASSTIDSAIQNGFDNHGHIIDDPRVTKTGKILRKYWIDELPQIYNLLKGDIKLIGIRPETEQSWARMGLELKNEALKQKPGLIGVSYAFKNNTYQDHLDNSMKYLREYNQNKIFTDFKYFMRFLYNVFFNKTRSE